MKTCNRCGETKPLDDFYTRKGGVKGRRAECKSCFLGLCKTRYRAKPPEFREQERARLTEWRNEHRDEARKHAREWARKHPDYIKENLRQWRQAHPEMQRIQAHRRRLRVATVGGEVAPQEWLDLVDAFDHRCACCGRDDVPLTMDHVVPLARFGPNTIDNIQPLCQRCNSTKSTKIEDYRK